MYLALRKRGIWLRVLLPLCLALTLSTPQLLGKELAELHEEVVVTANSMPVPFKNLARTVRVLSRADIEKLPARSVADLLRYFTSVEVKSRGVHGVQSDLSIRGSGFEQVLVLVNGTRINDAQSGHHNSDIPVSLSDVERIEVLYGPGSSLYGGDALAGVVNIITREENGEQRGRLTLGQYNLVSGSASLSVPSQRVPTNISVWSEGSSGFEFDREFRNLGFNAISRITPEARLGFYFVDKAFGANNFYGPSPSKEWTNTALASLDHQLFNSRTWRILSGVAYRTHGDHFRWDVQRPGFAENQHRTHELNAQGKVHWLASDRSHVTMGAELGGNWINSSNLGDHSYHRLSAFLELEQEFTRRVTIYPGLRFDRYSHFGSAISPALSASWWVNETLKLRGSAGRSFRTPTFTELYYRDPNHRARSDLKPETATGVEAGLDWYVAPDIFLRGTAFLRREDNAIDWLRADSSQRWESANIREVKTRGIEFDLGHVHERGTVQGTYTFLFSDAGMIPFQSKYVLDYPRHAFALLGHASLPFDLGVGGRLDYRFRADGRNYWLLEAKVLKQVQQFRLFFEVSNLLNTEYQEIRDVNMPGRWFQAGMEFDLPWGGP